MNEPTDSGSIHLAEEQPWKRCSAILRELEDAAMRAKAHGAPSDACRVWISNHVQVYEERYAAGERSSDLVFDIAGEAFDAAAVEREWSKANEETDP